MKARRRRNPKLRPINQITGEVTKKKKMKKKKKKKKKEKMMEEKNDDTTAGFRNWSDLLDVLLVSIIDRLFSIPDIFAFAATCRSWRSVATSPSIRASLTSRPPLLLRPILALHPYRRILRWSDPAICRLQTLTNDITSYRSMVSSNAITRECIGYSHGHLIFTGRSALLADVFTGEEIRPPQFPSGYSYFSFGILTAPLSSSSCMLLLVNSDSSAILWWRPGSDEWSLLKLGYSRRIQSLVVFKGQVFGLDFISRYLVSVEFYPRRRLKPLKVQLPHHTLHHFGNFDMHLVECGGELLVVLFDPAEPVWTSWPLNINVYRLDFSKFMWVKMESLGDWCLFIDAVGKSSVACPNPTRWGGRNNCIYIVGPGCDTWSVFPLDGMAIDTITTESPLSSSNMALRRWPSPVWVFPSMLLSV